MGKRWMVWLAVMLCLFSGWAKAEETGISDAPMLLQNARWIWSGDTENNVWADFIKTFSIEEIPAEARAEISVENKYFLYVNGQQVVYD